MSVNKSIAIITTCPNCGSAVSFSKESTCRPFCSERCKMVDLDAWLNERYIVPAAAEEEDEPDY